MVGPAARTFFAKARDDEQRVIDGEPEPEPRSGSDTEAEEDERAVAAAVRMTRHRAAADNYYI